MIQNLEKHYQVLGLKPGASLEEVNQAYKDLVFIWHPDRVPRENERLVQKSVEKLQQINEARDSLRSYHRKYPSQPANGKPNNSYSANPYYRDRSQTYSRSAKSASNSYQHKSDYSSYSNPRSSQTWDYRAYYTTSSNKGDQAYNSRDGYQDFRESGYSSSSQTNNYKRPYNKDLRGADLSRSNFKEKDFSGRDLSQADLSYADLSDTFLHKINLEKANLQGANLKGANLLQANLKGANLKGANLIGADLSGSDLSGADLSGAKVGFNKKIMVKLTAIKLTGAILPDGSIHP